MSADLVRARIDEGPVVPLMWLVVLLGFLLNLADGTDVVAMSVTAPSVAASWVLSARPWVHYSVRRCLVWPLARRVWHHYRIS